MNGIEKLATISEIKKRIDSARSIAIFAHINIDGDAIGSMLSLYEFLESRNKNVSMFCDQTEIPESYKFLNNVDLINKKSLGKYDLLIAVDSASSDRLGRYGRYFTEARNTINIDHHVTNNYYANMNLVLPYSSCGEIIFEVLQYFDSEISTKTATALFTAISADTGNFTNVNVNARSYLIAGKLAELGADINKVNMHLHKYKTFAQLKLAGYMATNLVLKNGVAYILLTKKTLTKLKVLENEVGRFVSLIKDVKGAKITLIMKEIENNKFRISFRSVEEIDVSKIANIYKGGGHKNASACTIEGKSNKILKDVLKECHYEINRNIGIKN